MQQVTTISKLSRRTVCALALILILGCLAWKAGKEGIAHFYVHSAHQEINRWATSGQRFRGDEWARTMQYLSESLRYSPNNAWSLEEMGTFQLRRMRATKDPALAVAAVRSANAHFHMTLRERPASPFAWANLSLSKLYLGELDEELFAALRHADELGPWEPEVQQTVLFVGFAAWHKLGSAQRAAMVLTLERAVQRDAPKVTEIVTSFNRFDLLCAINSSKLKLEEQCGRARKSATPFKRLSNGWALS